MFPAGVYYIGDLCYVMKSKWDSVCEILFNNMNSGEHVLDNGTRFACYYVHEDGTYYDQYNRKYSVDSGTIGCCNIDSCDQDKLKEALINKLGYLVEMKESFCTYCDEGIININNIRIRP